MSRFFDRLHSQERNEIFSNLNQYFYFSPYESISNFGERCLNVLTKSNFRVQKNFIIHGMNPRDYLSLNYMPDAEYDLVDDVLSNNTKMYMVFKNFKEKNPNKLTDCVILTTLNILKHFGYNEADYFLKQVDESPMSFQLDFRSYALNYQDLVSFSENFGLQFHRLLEYIFFEFYNQGISEIDNDIMRTYRDVLNMQLNMYGKINEKYPKYLKVYHDQINLKYNIWVKFHDEEVLLNNLSRVKNLAYHDSQYQIIIPKSSQEIVQEGIDNHHCVASYVDDVIAGRTSILFMRTLSEPETSLITLEYHDGALYQSKGLSNRHVNDEENGFLLKWMKLKKIKDERNDIDEYQRLGVN